MRRWLVRNLLTQVSRDHRESSAVLRRRQRITVAVIVVGAVVLGISLRTEPGSGWFYVATVALAVVWSGGAVLSGRLYLGGIEVHGQVRRPVGSPIVIGLALAAVFLAGGLLAREVPALNSQVDSVLDFAAKGSLPLVLAVTVINGVAEELFFRGAVYAATPRYPILVSAIVYVLVVLAAGNLMLGFAALVLAVVVGLQRRASGGVLAPMLTHVTWAVVMLFALPALFGT